MFFIYIFAKMQKKKMNKTQEVPSCREMSSKPQSLGFHFVGCVGTGRVSLFVLLCLLYKMLMFIV